MTGDKFRFRFAKTGTLRLVSHHDLMRCTERMLRRAAVPFKSTAGFHPTPRFVFALSAPLGVVCHDEVVELELIEPRDGNDLLCALNEQAPAGLRFTRVAAVAMKTTARVRRVVYELSLPADRAAQVEVAARALLAEPKVWVERLRPSAKRLNLRPYVRGMWVAKRPTPPAPLPVGRGEKVAESLELPSTPESASDSPSLQGGGRGVGLLTLDFWVTQDGTARADELLRLLNIDDLLDGGAVLHRTAIELRDEITATDPADVPPDGPADAVPLSGAEAAALAARLDDETNQQPAEAAWGASPNGPVVE